MPFGNRRYHILIIILLILSLVFFFGPHQRLRLPLLTNSPFTVQVTEIPPKYLDLYKWEHNLPQHDLDLPFPEGKTGRYVLFRNQIRALGWNNVLNEVLMNTHLAYESKRAYVFQDYYWKLEYYPWPTGGWWPQTPLNALIAGPSAGGLWDAGDDAPRSVSEDWYEIVCPPDDRRIINTRDVKPPVAQAQGNDIFDHWARLLRDAPERCVEIHPAPGDEDNYPQTFDLWLWGSDRILPLWEAFLKSPTSRLLATSPLVSSAVLRNEYLFHPRGPKPNHAVSRNPYDRMMAMHIRRGDFKGACLERARWNSTYYSWNLLPSLPDHFVPPPGGGWGKNTPENIEAYMAHCLPTLDAIVQKVRDSKADYAVAGRGRDRTLDVMYVLTNDDSDWTQRLKNALRADGWHTIVTTSDLKLDVEQTGVNMAVDMDIARRAAVFIGNGWSSFTSNVVHRRLADGKEEISCRFW